MKVTYVALSPTQAHESRQGIALTPELLAATGARYSRNNEGLHEIVSKIDPKNTDKSVDSIFRMVDYGHASIADMAPVAIFIDGLSLFAAYFLWAHAPTGSGQESSTRYIRFDDSGIVNPKILGIQKSSAFLRETKRAFATYQKAAALWLKLATTDPSIMRIPQSAIDDTSEKGQKRLERMRRNYAFDRARVFLPACAKTNTMMTMSARSWVELISLLLSVPYPELNLIGKKVKKELEYATPRLTKHATYKQATYDIFMKDFEALKSPKLNKLSGDGAYLFLHEITRKNLKSDLAYRTNRYSLCGKDVRMTPVTFGWKKIAFAELRDLNRHRTGAKCTTFSPNGFYDVTDQAPTEKIRASLKQLARFGEEKIARIHTKIRAQDMTYVYDFLLGHTVEFRHTTTLDKYIYEAELRTGIGSHYRYAYHLHNTLAILYKLHPELKGMILEGTAEPE